MPNGCFACFCWKWMPHRRRANEVSLCYLQSGGTCTGRSKLDNLHRQEDSLEPAPAGWTINQTNLNLKPNLFLLLEWKRKFDWYFDYATGNFWPIFPQDIFTDQISRSQIDGNHWIEVWFFVWDQVTSKSVWFDCLPWRKLWIQFFVSLSSQASIVWFSWPFFSRFNHGFSKCFNWCCCNSPRDGQS